MAKLSLPSRKLFVKDLKVAVRAKLESKSSQVPSSWILPSEKGKFDFTLVWLQGKVVEVYTLCSVLTFIIIVVKGASLINLNIFLVINGIFNKIYIRLFKYIYLYNVFCCRQIKLTILSYSMTDPQW